MYIRNAILFVALAAPLNALPWNRRNNWPPPVPDTPVVDNSSTVQLPGEVVSSPLPTILQNTTLPTPGANSSISNGDQGPIVVPTTNTSSTESADNGTVSKVISTDNGTVVVGDTNTTAAPIFFRPGTYDSAPGVQDTPVAFSFTGAPDPLAAISDAAAQPSYPELDGCTYEYRPVLGPANGTKPGGGLWALENYVWLTSANVQQGSIGDCGMGSAIMSLASQGIGASSWTQYLAKTISYTVTDLQGIRQLAFRFKYPGKEATVLIDDQLPTLTSGSCWPYLGFQPTLDAVCPGEDGSYPPTNVFFVPLLEKAFAKYIDAFPELRSPSATDAGWTGYKGLTGIRPDVALAAFTGGTPNSLFRNLDSVAPIILQLLACIRDDVICAVDTYEAGTLDGMGPKDEYGVVHLLGDSGWAAPNTQWNQTVSYTLIDFDNLNAEGRSKLVEMIGLHAYGIDYAATPYPGIVKLLNPWGCNPSYSDQSGYCGSYEGGPRLELSLRVYASMLRAVYWVDNPIALGDL